MSTVEFELLNAPKLPMRSAAARVGISESSLRRLIWRGELAALTVSGKIMVLERDLEALLRRSYRREIPTLRESARREKPEVRRSPHLDF